MKRIRLFTVLLLCLLLSACGKVDPAPAVTEPVQTFSPFDQYLRGHKTIIECVFIECLRKHKNISGSGRHKRPARMIGMEDYAGNDIVGRIKIIRSLSFGVKNGYGIADSKAGVVIDRLLDNTFTGRLRKPTFDHLYGIDPLGQGHDHNIRRTILRKYLSVSP